MKSENNELAKEFAVWCWGKEVSSDVSKIESLFLDFLAENEVKLKERNFEILSFLNKSNNEVYERYKERFYLIEKELRLEVGNRDLSYCLKYYKINSIKRLSDGEIFALGDRTTKGIIEKIMLNNSKSVFGISTDLYKCWNGSATFEKAKRYLFTALDGVDIFEGDSYFYLDCNLTSVFACTIADKDFRPPLSFSTPIAAKNYKTENEKRYSLKDVRKTINEYFPNSENNNILGECILETLEKNGNL